MQQHTQLKFGLAIVIQTSHKPQLQSSLHFMKCAVERVDHIWLNARTPYSNKQPIPATAATERDFPSGLRSDYCDHEQAADYAN
jgi:hypothetical protein